MSRSPASTSPSRVEILAAAVARAPRSQQSDRIAHVHAAVDRDVARPVGDGREDDHDFVVVVDPRAHDLAAIVDDGQPGSRTPQPVDGRDQVVQSRAPSALPEPKELRFRTLRESADNLPDRVDVVRVAAPVIRDQAQVHKCLAA
jgi:hypothetical protein